MNEADIPFHTTKLLKSKSFQVFKMIERTDAITHLTFLRLKLRQLFNFAFLHLVIAMLTSQIHHIALRYIEMPLTI